MDLLHIDVSKLAAASDLMPPDARAANAWQHGLRGRRVVVSAEERQDFDTLRAALIEDWRPRSVTAWLLVDHLARLQWRLLRAGEAEAEKLGRLQAERGPGTPAGKDAPRDERDGPTRGDDDGAIGDTCGLSATDVDGPDAGAGLASAEAALAWDVGRAGSSLQRIQVYQMRLERAVHRCIALLIALRKSRGKRGNLGRTAARKKPPQPVAGPGVAAETLGKNGTNKTDAAAGT